MIASLANLLIIAVFLGPNEAVGAGPRSCQPDLLVTGIELPVTNVVRDGAAKDMGRLQYDAEVRLQPMQTPVPVIDSIQQNSPGGRFIESAQQIDQRRLAATCGTDNSDTLALPDGEVDILEHSRSVCIVEADVFELDQTDHILHSIDGNQAGWVRFVRLHSLVNSGRVLDLRFRFNQADGPFCGCLSHLHFSEPVGKFFDRFEEVTRVGEKGDQSTGRDESCNHFDATQHQSQSAGQRTQSQHDRKVNGSLHCVEYRGIKHPRAELTEVVQILRFSDKCLAGLHPHNALVKGSSDTGVGLSDRACTFQYSLLKRDADPGKNRQHRQYRDGQ